MYVSERRRSGWISRPSIQHASYRRKHARTPERLQPRTAPGGAVGGLMVGGVLFLPPDDGPVMPGDPTETLLAAARYVELNPVRARLVTAPSDYRWSSARAHIKRRDDCLVKVAPLLKLAKNWRRLLTSAATEEQIKAFREHERTGRVLGDDDFQRRLEKKLGRILRRQKPGPRRTSTE